MALQLNGNLTTYIGGTKHDIHNRARGLVHRLLKCYEHWSTNGLKLDRSFYPPSVHFAFYYRYIARLCRCRSANATQPNFAKR